MGENNLPKHIAIIMDGNGRWAKGRGLSRIRGHVKGVDAVREITTECAKRHIEQLTLYAFSKENWSRPKYEIEILMRLLKRYLVRERPTILENNIRFTVIGQIEGLPKNIQREIETNIEESKSNTGTILCLALNYGGRAEIVDAAKALAADVVNGRLSINEIDEDVFKHHLYTSGMSDPDLLIRTGGDMRISNFLLWEISYAELWITPVCWPDFKKEHLLEAIKAYSQRERRFGGLIE